MRLRHALALITATPALLAQAEWKARVLSADVTGRSVYETADRSSRVRIDGDAIQVRGKKTGALDIPLSSVTGVQYDRTGKNIALIILERIGEAAEANACSYDCVVALMLSPAFAPFRHNHHFVNISWRGARLHTKLLSG